MLLFLSSLNFGLSIDQSSILAMVDLIGSGSEDLTRDFYNIVETNELVGLQNTT